MKLKVLKIKLNKKKYLSHLIKEIMCMFFPPPFSFPVLSKGERDGKV